MASQARAPSLAAALHEPAEGEADRAELVGQLGELGPLAPSEGADMVTASAPTTEQR